jgi:hypothetical protein
MHSKRLSVSQGRSCHLLIGCDRLRDGASIRDRMHAVSHRRKANTRTDEHLLPTPPSQVPQDHRTLLGHIGTSLCADHDGDPRPTLTSLGGAPGPSSSGPLGGTRCLPTASPGLGRGSLISDTGDDRCRYALIATLGAAARISALAPSLYLLKLSLNAFANLSAAAS